MTGVRAIGLYVLGVAVYLSGMGPAVAAETVGRVITQVGEVVAVGPDGERRPLRRRSEIREGERVVTGEGGRAQVRFKDGALVDIKPDSAFAVKRYRSEEAGDEEDSAVMGLLKGGMRTITGAVGGGEGQEYEVETPVASIGVRGTQYLLRLCDGACGDVPGGLYGGVTQGRIAVSNDAGSKTFGGDRYFHVASRGDLPRGILQPPTDLVAATGGRGGGEDGEGGDGEGDAGESGEDASGENLGSALNALADQDDSMQVFEVPEEDFEASEESNNEGQPTGLESDPTPEPEIWGASHLLAQETLYSGYSGMGYPESGATVSIDDEGVLKAQTITATENLVIMDFQANQGAEPAGTGRNLDLGVYWGRWAAGDFSLKNTVPGEPAGDFHYAYVTDPTAAEQLGSLTGTATYNWGGGTTPTSSTGTWQVDSFSMDVNFGDRQISGASLELSPHKGTSGDSFIVNEYSSVELSSNFRITMGASGAQGTIYGQFVGPSAEGSMVIFSVKDAIELGSTVTGAGLLKR
ncbi:FecR family protein [Thiohalorhabdus sp. Cl-TMA]|uniref:FecR domain-containing protein n=1 Tax=Thiohalorhabdus methylotrophus TaxID=3242694 RepID=A0ABV4TUC8_9GAMM